MSLIRRKKTKAPEPIDELITLKEASALLRLDESTIRRRQCGTHRLTHVPQGEGKRQRIYLIKSEVIRTPEQFDYCRPRATTENQFLRLRLV